MKTPDRTLLQQARGGSREAFGELIRRYRKRVWLVARQYVGASEADVVVQESFLKAYTRLESFDERSRFSTWLTRITMNTAIDFLRKQQRRPVAGELPEHDVLPDRRVGPEELSRQRQAVARLLEEVKKLPEGQQQVFRLRFFAHLELAEIAELLGVHTGTVKTQLHRAVHGLRRKLEDFR